MTKQMQTSAQPIQLTLFDLEALETKVRAGLAGFLEVGEALMQIRDQGGYKLRGFETFEDYCQTQFGFSVRQGQRLIVAARTTEVIQQLTGEAPASESVAREFARVTYSPEAVQEVHAELKAEKKSVGKATAQDVKRVVTKVLEKVKPQAKPAPKTLPKNGKSEPRPELPPAPAAIESMSFCPNCGEEPERYERKGEAWYCGACGGRVTIGVALP